VREVAHKENISQEAVENIYQQIVAASKSAEGIVVAFQGERGAYSEEAVFQFFGSSTEVKPCENLDSVFKAVEEGEDYELIFTISKGHAARLIRQWPFKTKLSKIGNIIGQKNRFF
jgi:hypothetical protein